MKFGDIRSQLNCLIETAQRISGRALPLKRQTKIVESIGPLCIELQGAAVLHNRLFNVTVGLKYIPKIGMEGRHPRVRRDGPAKHDECLAEVAILVGQQSKPVQTISVLGDLPQDLAIQRTCFG